MTAADSARFKDFEPQWDKTEVELLPNNGKMLIVPVVRFLSVEYNQNIGFIRRLCIRVDANEDFIEANIVELVGNLTFVKENYNAIFKNYKENNISGFSGVVIINEIDYTGISTKKYDNSVFTGYGSLTMQGGSTSGNGSPQWCSNGIIFEWGYFDSGGVWIVIDRRCANISTIPPINDGEIPSGSPIGPLTPGPTNPNPNNPNNNGGGGSGNNNPTINYPPPPPMPHPGMVLNENNVWEFPLPIDPGFSWGETEGWGDGIPRDENGLEIENVIDDIYDAQNSTLTPAQKAQLNKIFDSLKKKSCLFGEMIAKMKQAGVKIKFNFDNTMTVGGSFNYFDNSISINNVSETALLELPVPDGLSVGLQIASKPAGFIEY